MTSYHGGKQKKGLVIAQTIIDYLNKHQNTSSVYIEPFCGMLGVFYPMFIKSKTNFTKFIASDVSLSVIQMWQELLQGWTPPSIVTREEFRALKYNGTSSALKGFVGHQFSFGGSYFSSFQKPFSQQKSVNRVKQMALTMSSPEFPKITPLFNACDYLDYTLENTSNAVIYCDPPYNSTVCYYYNDERKRPKFNTNEFWNWVLQLAQQNTLFVSEFSIPPKFENYFDKLDTFSSKTNYFNNHQNTNVLYHDNLYLCNIKENQHH